MVSERVPPRVVAYVSTRGFTVAEVEETIGAGSWEEAELGRLECREDLSFRAEWNGCWYATKQVRPIFVDEPEEIVVITVYTYYY